MLGLSLFVAVVMPPRNRRTRQTDALEFALVTLLTVIFSPLSFNYAYVWLIYPTTLALHRVISEPSAARWHRLKVAWIAAVVLIPALAIPMPLLAQAYEHDLPALLLVIGLGAMLYSAGDARHRASRRSFDLVFSPRMSWRFKLGCGCWAFVAQPRIIKSGIAFFRALANNAASSGEASSAKECGGWKAHGSRAAHDRAAAERIV